MQILPLKKRSELHHARKLWHVGGVLLIALVHSMISRETAIVLLLLSAAVVIPIDIARHRNPKLNEFVISIFRHIIRVNEVDRLSGNSYLILGVLFITLFFDPTITSLTLLFLAFADPIASYFGILYGKDKIWGNKSLQGFLAAFFVCAGISAYFLYRENLFTDRLLIVSLLAGLIGALSELIQIGKLDDNLTLPILSGLGLKLLFIMFGGA